MLATLHLSFHLFRMPKINSKSKHRNLIFALLAFPCFSVNLFRHAFHKVAFRYYCKINAY